jgi:hypothetical protein
MNIVIPKSWSEIYLDQFVSIRTLETKSIYSNSLEILSILTDTSSNDAVWDDMDIDEMNDLINDIMWLKNEPTTNFKRHIGDFEIVDINKITFGEFLDLEYYFTDYYNNLSKICAVLYRKYKIDDWGIKRYEPYPEYNLDERALLFQDMFITEIYGVIKYYLDFKELIHKTYDLFEPTDLDYDEEDLDEEDLEAEKSEKIYRNWVWENILHKLSNGDITKYDRITAMPLIFIFNQLSFMKDMKI